MSAKAVVVGLTGGVDTVSANRAALENAGITEIHAVDVASGATRAEMHEALRAQVKIARTAHPHTPIIVLKDSAVPFAGEQAFPDGTLSIGAHGRTLSATTIGDLIDAASRLVIEVPATAAKAAPQPDPVRIIVPSVEPTGRAAKLAKKAAKHADRIDEEKPTIVMVHPKPVDVRALNLSSGKAKLVHVVLSPMDAPAEYINAEGRFDSSVLGGIQAKKGEKPAFFQWMTQAMGLSFWKKFDAAAGSNAQLAEILVKYVPDDVVICGDIPREYKVSIDGLKIAMGAHSQTKTPEITPYSGEIAPQTLRLVVNNAANKLAASSRAA